MIDRVIFPSLGVFSRWSLPFPKDSAISRLLLKGNVGSYHTLVRRNVDKARLHEFMRRLAAESQGPGSVYFTGGATMLLLGVREQTIDVDIKLDPEPKGVFEAIAVLKNELDINVELASPDDFLPPLPDWRQKSIPIAVIGDVSFLHYDCRAQALAKLERGLQQDISDVSELIRQGVVTGQDLISALNQIKPDVIRYPAIELAVLEKKVARFLGSIHP